MNDIQIFQNPEFGKIRTIDRDGEPWMVGVDVAKALGYAAPRNAIASHVDEEDKTSALIQGTGSNYKSMAILINESGLYSLILSSKLPNAREFKRWVTNEVLPSIRKHGGYIAGQDQLTPEELMAKALQVANKTLAEREARISALTVQNAIMAPKAEYFDELVDRNTLTSFRDTAKELGIKPRAFVDWLLEKKFIYRDQKGKLMPREGKGDGLFEVKEAKNDKTQWSGVQTLVTPKGRETFRLLYL
nr:MAG TPA: repressor domain protein [Caudoviricetes sp.]